MGIITHLGSRFFAFLFLSLLSIFVLVHTKSSSLDAAVMLILRQNLNASKSLGWIDPDPCQWQHVSCSEDGRVTRIQIGYQNLTGCLPSNLSYLTALQILDLSSNQLQGPLPSLAGLSSLQNLSLSNNNFSSIPFDFFFGMTSLERVYLDNNPFDPAPIPISLQSASNLKVFSANASNFSSKIPYFFGTFARLTTLHLAFNNLHGVLPATFSSSSIQSLWLNEQQSTFKLHGSIDVIQNMTQLKEVWLDSNSFSGPMPDFSRLMGLESFRVRDNSITGQVPASILDLPWLKVVSLTNNLLQGPTPKFNSSVTIDMETGSNSFCLPVHGAACNPRVNKLLSIAQFSGYPVVFSENWKGNDPCNGWFGLHCENENITVVNFSNLGLTGMISPNFSSIVSLQILILASNNLAGMIPNELTTLPNLRELDISNNCLHGKIPSFKSNVVVNTNGNPDIWMDVDSGNRYLSVVNVGLVIGGICVVLFVGILIYMCKRKHYGHIHVIESERMVISIHVLKNATRNFSQENILGRGGFGIVYKGALHDGTKIAVKRMDSGVLCERGWDQFKSEIVVLSKVRHKHLVSLFGYCLDANERLLVYEYMPQGTLSRHLFRWKEEGLKPLEWLRRLTIALDVARGVEYLHVLAHRSFIHRDLKPSNILLGDDMHAKVGDFGLVRLVPDGKSSILTKLAGTFGYLAPEYAVTGRVTTKIDVFSFGVILLQLMTGRKAVVELETEHDEYVGIVAWFYKMRMQKDAFHKAIDSTINLDEETLVSIDTVAELAGHCCANNHSQRPDMGHIVNVLSTLVDHWSPSNSHCDEGFGSFGEVKPKDYSHIF